MTNNFNQLKSIHFETALLELLEWDENELNDVLKKLTEYFSVCTKNDLDLVKVDLSHIFNEDIANLVYNYLLAIERSMLKDTLGEQ